MVRQRQNLIAKPHQRSTTSLPRRGFQPARMMTLNLYITNHKRNVEGRTQAAAHIAPNLGARHQTVADMSSRQGQSQRIAKADQHMQQDGGIEPAAQTDPNMPGRRRELSPVAGDKGDWISRRQFP